MSLGDSHRQSVAAVFGLLLTVAACTSGDADPTIPTTTTTMLGSTTPPIMGWEDASTFTGEGIPPAEVLALLRPGDRDILTWGRAAGAPWALVTWDLVEEGKPPLTCTEVLPLAGTGMCATPEGSGVDVQFPPQAFLLGKGGLLVFYTDFGVDRLAVVSPGGPREVEIHGEAMGYPPTGVLPTPGHSAMGTITALDANGNAIGESREFSFTPFDFRKTPLPA
jgi:hypothetical protein